MIEGRISVPLDVFAVLCVSIAQLSDALLLVAQIVAKESATTPHSTILCSALNVSNIFLGALEGHMRSIMEEASPRGWKDSGGLDA